jgi:hypothetical protein
MPCLVLQVDPLYIYIYSPERLNNTSITLRHISPLPFYKYLEIIVKEPQMLTAYPGQAISDSDQIINYGRQER